MKDEISAFYEISDYLEDEILRQGYALREDEEWLSKLLSGETVKLYALRPSTPDIYISCENEENRYMFWVERVVFPTLTANQLKYADDVEHYVNNNFARAAKLCTFLNQYTLWK